MGNVLVVFNGVAAISVPTLLCRVCRRPAELYRHAFREAIDLPWQDTSNLVKQDEDRYPTREGATAAVELRRQRTRAAGFLRRREALQLAWAGLEEKKAANALTREQVEGLLDKQAAGGVPRKEETVEKAEEANEVSGEKGKGPGTTSTKKQRRKRGGMG